MTIEVIIPEMRPQHVDNILHSFNITGAPDLITFVSNLNIDIRVPKPCPVRQLRYSSTNYSTGPFTTGLKRNIGIWWAKHPDVVLFDDDQLASHGMMKAFYQKFTDYDVVYGHHRFIDYNKYSVDEILAEKPTNHIPREKHIGKHWWESGYAGLLGIKQDVYIGIGGTDMWWSNCGSHEDQDFARRLMRARGWNRIQVHEPPFAWHPLYDPLYRLPITPEPDNLCNGHNIVTKSLHNINYEACTKCAYHYAPRIEMSNVIPLMPFNPLLVDVTETWL